MTFAVGYPFKAYNNNNRKTELMGKLEKELDEIGNSETVKKEVDVYRDTPVRLLGYANEVGEAFRPLVPVRFVHASYLIASGYVLADTGDKVNKLRKVLPSNDPNYKKKIAFVGADTLIWQSFASVIIPGFTINRICALSLYLLKKLTSLPPATRKWTTTAIGLGCIPLIFRPIDNFVHLAMDASVRKWMEMEKKEPPY